MPQNPLSSQSSYCSPERLLDYVDWWIVADLIRDDRGPRPTLPETVSSPVVLAALKAASGELESACLVRGQYQPSDLAALNGVGRAYLERVVSGLAVATLFSRRSPASGRMEEIPAARYAQDVCERLRLGERVFGFVENSDAVGMKTAWFQQPPEEPERNTVQYAERFFGHRVR